MIPLRDSIPSRTTPVVNYAIIGICTLAFLAQLTAGDGGRSLIERFGMIPARLTNPDEPQVIRERVLVRTNRGIEQAVVQRELAASPFSPWLTMVSCMFLHGGWMHFLGNMWFLYVFGDNVEDRLGHFGYACTYVGTGVAAGAAHYMSNGSSPIPTIGASGAIAGVMGAYAWLYPKARVQAVLPLFVIIQIFVLPAPVFLGIWFAMQTYSGIASASAGEAGGVAWWAHVGGFVAGAIVAIVVGRAHYGREAVEERRF